jgi:hypothetical protein
MKENLKPYYIFLLVVALLASFYSYFKTGISSPSYPSLLHSKLKTSSFMQGLKTSSSIAIDKETSDRKLSPIYQYKLKDGSILKAVMVRVRKRDDFKIETYGLLTKGIDEIYIKSPTFIPNKPYSMIGIINGKKTLQTCILPGTKKLDEVNVQLFPLIAQADRLAGNSQSLLSKLLGTDDRADYSCLVLTYQPHSLGTAKDQWEKIIHTVQLAMSDRRDL